MNTNDSDTTTGRRRAAGAVFDQFVVAGTSFALMLLVRSAIGVSALGEYAWLINAMIVLTALQTAWVGDSLTVLNRFDPEIRSGLAASILSFGGVAFALSVFLARGVLDLRGAVLFGTMVVLWITEEIGRRLFMTRLEFWALTANDTIYALGAFSVVAIAKATDTTITLNLVVGAMAVGASLSILAALIQLPTSEFHAARPSWIQARALASFAGWRSAQLSLRPIAQFAVRSIVIVVASKTIAGDLETARLFSQPAATYVSGIASFLLPMYTREERTQTRSISLSKMTALLVAPVLLYGTFVVVAKNPLARLILLHHASVSVTAILGWLATALMFAAGQPIANLLIARKQSRDIFWVRFADSVVGLTLAAVLIKTVSPDFAPWSLAIGMAFGTVGLAVLVRRGDARLQPALVQSVGAIS